jgi:hypothetical protein
MLSVSAWVSDRPKELCASCAIDVMWLFNTRKGNRGAMGGGL